MNEMICSYKYNNNISNCSGEIYDQELDRCIFHCKKDEWFSIDSNNKKTWNIEKVDNFWREIRKAISEHKHDDIFKGFEFPDIDIDILSIKRTKDNRFIEDFYFWYKDEVMEFDKNLIFRNCIFYKLKFYDILCKNISFDNSTIYESLEISYMTMDSLRITKTNSECIITLDSVNIQSCYLYENNISILEFNNCDFKDLTIIKSIFEELVFSKIVIKKGIFLNFSVDEIINGGLSIVDKEQFTYVNIDVKKASRSYYGYLKYFFLEKKDYINANDMYEKEMNRYFYDTWHEVKKRKNLNSSLQNLVITGFGKFSSNFGKSWIRALGWIVFISFLNVYMVNDCNLSYCFSGYGNLWNKMAKIFYLIDKDSFGFMELIFKIILGIFIYQLVISIKRKNKY